MAVSNHMTNVFYPCVYFQSMDGSEEDCFRMGGSETDGELDSEVEDTDAEQELSVWLDQLNQIQQVGKHTLFVLTIMLFHFGWCLQGLQDVCCLFCGCWCGIGKKYKEIVSSCYYLNPNWMKIVNIKNYCW